MTFEEILPHLKQGKKIIRKGFSGAEVFIELVQPDNYQGEKVLPNLLIYVTGEGYASYLPTVCDLLAEDWQLVAHE